MHRGLGSLVQNFCSSTQVVPLHAAAASERELLLPKPIYVVL